MIKIFSFQFLKELLSAVFWSAWVANILEQGHSLNEASFLLAVYFLSNAVFEVPTGIFADHHGRRLSTLIGIALTALGFFINGVSTLSFGSKLVAFFITGIGFTFTSGASTAWFLSIAKKWPSFHQDHFFLELDLVGRIATISGAFLGVRLLQASPAHMWWITAAVALIALPLGLTMPDPMEKAQPTLTRESLVKSGKWSALAHPAVMAVIVSGALFGLEAGVRNVIYQPYILDLNHGSLYWLAYFQSTLALTRLAGNLVYKYYLIRFSLPAQMAAIALFIFGVAELVASQTGSYWVFMGFYAPAVFALGWYIPIRSSFLNSLLPDNRRATLLSFDSMVTGIMSATCCAMLGVFAFRDQIQKWWLFGGACLLVSAFVFALAPGFKQRQDV